MTLEAFESRAGRARGLGGSEAGRDPAEVPPTWAGIALVGEDADALAALERDREASGGSLDIWRGTVDDLRRLRDPCPGIGRHLDDPAGRRPRRPSRADRRDPPLVSVPGAQAREARCATACARSPRRAGSARRARAMAAEVAERFLALPEVEGARTVMAFSSFGSELPMEPLIDALCARGVTRGAAEDRRRERWRCAPTARGIRPRVTSFGAHEPADGAVIDPRAIDVVVTPAVAYDRTGRRVGYGGGFYDRFLPRTRPRCRCGSASAPRCRCSTRTLPAGSFDLRVHRDRHPTGGRAMSAIGGRTAGRARGARPASPGAMRPTSRSTSRPPGSITRPITSCPTDWCRSRPGACWRRVAAPARAPAEGTVAAIPDGPPPAPDRSRGRRPTPPRPPGSCAPRWPGGCVLAWFAEVEIAFLRGLYGGHGARVATAGDRRARPRDRRGRRAAGGSARARVRARRDRGSLRRARCEPARRPGRCARDRAAVRGPGREGPAVARPERSRPRAPVGDRLRRLPQPARSPVPSGGSATTMRTRRRPRDRRRRREGGRHDRRRTLTAARLARRPRRRHRVGGRVPLEHGSGRRPDGRSTRRSARPPASGTCSPPASTRSPGPMRRG